MSNVVDLFSKVHVEDKVLKYMLSFLDWAENQGIDITTQNFKYDAAIIRITIQSMLLKD